MSSVTQTNPPAKSNFHPLLLLFPEMEKPAFAEFVHDIKVNGQHEPIWMYKGQVLDGRNRWLAAEVLGIKPLTREYMGDEQMTLTKKKADADVCALCKQPIDWSWKNGEPDISIQMSKGRIGKFAHSSCVGDYFEPLAEREYRRQRAQPHN